MDRYAACFLRKVLWLEDHFHQYYVQDRFVEADDMGAVTLRRFDEVAEAAQWLQGCVSADPFWTLSALRRFLACESLHYMAVHRLDDTRVIAQAAARIYCEPHAVVQEPLLDDRFALQRIETLTVRLRHQLAALAKSRPAPQETQPAPENALGLIQAIPASVRKHTTTFKERMRAQAELSILIHDPPLRELLLDFARRYDPGGDGPLDAIAGLLCEQGTKAPSQVVAQTRRLIGQIAEELKPLRVRDPLPQKEIDPLAPVKRPAAEAQKNWVDLDYRYADGTGVAGAKYEVFDAGGGRLTAGTLGGDGTGRAGIALGISHVQVRYSDDPKQKAVLKAGHPTPVSAPPGWSDRMSAALKIAWQASTDAADWTWGVIKGDFNEDPSMGQIITNAVITAIPLVDQVGDARDLAAGVKMLAWDKRFKEYTVWLGLFFTLIGLVPGLGSLLKGVLKLILKSAPIEKILAVFNHFMQGNGVRWLKELKAGKLKAYVQQAGAKGHAIFAAAIDNLSRLKQHMPQRLTALRARADDLLAGLRRAKAMIDEQFDRIGRELTQKLDAILAKKTDDLEGGSAKGTVKKQQRAEAPADDPPIKAEGKGVDAAVGRGDTPESNINGPKKAEVDAFQARTSPEITQSVLKQIDPSRFSPDTRFGKAFYVAENGDVAIAEVAYHGTTPTHVIRYELDLSKAKVLDLTDPGIVKEWGAPGGNNYAATQAIAKKAQEAGYNVIKFPSQRAPGNNLAIFDNFDEILAPQMVTPVK